MSDFALVNKQVLNDILTEVAVEQDAAKAALLSFEKLIDAVKALIRW